MAQVTSLPRGLIGAPGGDIGEGLGEKVARPVHEGGAITNGGDVHHVAVLVYQFIQYGETAALVWSRYSCDGGLPGPVYHPSVGDKFRVSQCRFFWPRSKIVECSHLL